MSRWVPPACQSESWVIWRTSYLRTCGHLIQYRGHMSAITPSSTATAAVAPAPRRCAVAREAMVIEGHALAGVELAGYALGPALGTAPVVIVVGGITASPFPFGDPASGA